MAKKQNNITYDYACFMVLVYEYGDNKIKESEKKIKARLKYNGLGAYDKKRVNDLRKLTEELSKEINLYDKSAYYAKSNNEFCDIEDFDHRKMAIDLAPKYPAVNRIDLGSIVTMAVHLFHCR